MWAYQKIADRDSAEAARAAAWVLAGRFRFLNEERELGDPVDWALTGHPGAPRLWRFSLHYHEFLWDLAAGALRNGDAVLWRRVWELVGQWIEACGPVDPRTRDDAWHPYCISRRLPVWIALWHALPAPAELRPKVLASLVDQARYLAGHLEWDVRGNHLLQNLRGLVVAGAFFQGPLADGWVRRAARLLRQQLAEQILAHGEHFERSPMYHADALGALADIRAALQAVPTDLAGPVEEAVEKMARFLAAIVHPDGRIPLFGDSALDSVPALLPRSAGLGTRAGANILGDQGGATVRGSAWCSGAGTVGPYWVFRDGGDFVVFDAGPVGCDHLPAHAHADLLGLEASWHGQRLLVDSGVFDYGDSPMRRYCRSTAAHNCLEIDGQDQCDMWSRFRMGYRGWPGPLATGQCEGFYWAWAWHNAYRRLGVPRVGRLVACRSGGPWLCVDWAEGRGTHRLTSRLHLHPEVCPTPVGGNGVELQCAAGRLRLQFLGRGALAIEAGWYCPEFGLRLPAPVLRFETETTLPASIGWCLVPADGDLARPGEWLRRILSAGDSAGLPPAVRSIAQKEHWGL